MNIRVCLLVSAALVAAGCSTTTTGEATAPSNVTAYPSSKAPARTSAPSTDASPQTIPPEAFDEVRAQGVIGTDAQIGDVIVLACIMADGSYNDSVQDVVDVMQQMGSELSDAQLDVLVRVGLRYSCPENAAKLGA